MLDFQAERIRKHSDIFPSVSRKMFQGCDQARFLSGADGNGYEIVPHRQPALFMRIRSEAAKTGMDIRHIRLLLAGPTEGSAGVFESTSRSPTERNAADMPGSAAAVEGP